MVKVPRVGRWRTRVASGIFLCTAVLFMRFLATPSAAGNTYYVATSGSDSNPGTQSAPFATINRGAGVLQPGDTLFVRGGTYVQTVSIGNAGTAAAPITIAGYPGETAVIDGQDSIPGYWGVLVAVNGSYVVVRDLEVRNSAWMGFVLNGQFDQALNIYAHHNMENGILVGGNNSLVENCRVWWNAKSHENGVFKSGYGPTWATGLSAARHPINVTLRKNTVWNNWGEGLSAYEAENITMEDNIVYDNWLNIYLSDTKNTVVQRNMVYCSPSSVLNGSGADRVGILLGDEASNPPSSSNQIINNFVKGCNGNIYYWGSNVSGGLVNDLIAYNTLSDTIGPRANFQVNGGTHSNTRVLNNIIEQTNALPIGVVTSTSGLTFSNLWSQTPPSNVVGASSLVADPKLSKAGAVAAGQLTPSWFMILSSSPARDRGASVASITQDFFKAARDQAPDIGAGEYASALPAPPAPPAPPTGLRLIR
jgi:parallel beta-helix repeat protein